MTTTTTTNFNELAQNLAVLGNETRLKILAYLKDHPGASVEADLMVSLDLPQSVISRHLTVLRRVGVVTFDEGQGMRGKKHRYSLKNDALRINAEALAALA